MPIAKVHPCNSFGWLHVDAVDAQRAMQEKLRLRDAELATDRHASGEPAGFREWSIAHVRSLASQPQIASQLQRRQLELQQRLSSLDEQAAREAACYQVESSKISDELALLKGLSATP